MSPNPPDHKIVDRTKIRDGKVANRPIYVAMAVAVEGTRDILGIWAGDGGEGAKHWLQVFTELKNRGIEDVLMLVCDGLKGLPDAVETVWPRTVVQTCIVHLIRNSIRYCARQDWDKVAKDLKPVYTAPSEAAATERFLEFSEKWGSKYPAVIKLWSDAWAEMVPFLSFDVEIRKVICSTNAIESVNARIRKAVRARGHFPNEAAALKCVYMALMSLDPTGKGRRRWTMRWKAPLNAFQIAFEGRLTPPPATEPQQQRSAVDWTHPKTALMPLWMSSSGCGMCGTRSGEKPVDLPCDVAFEAADDFSARLALGKASLQVVPGAVVPAQAAEDDPVEGGVGLAVAAAVEPAALGLAGGRFDRAGAAQGSERCLAGEAFRVVTCGDEQGCGAVRADAACVEQTGRTRLDGLG